MRDEYIAIISGVMFGIGSVLLRIVFESKTLSFQMVKGVLKTPLFYAGAVIGFVAFWMFQKALGGSKAGIVVQLNTSFNILAAVIGGFLIGETVSVLKVSGIVLCLSGTLLLNKKGSSPL